MAAAVAKTAAVPYERPTRPTRETSSDGADHAISATIGVQKIITASVVL